MSERLLLLTINVNFKYFADENIPRSLSSSSRRVMWNVHADDEEIFDSVVNYRRYTSCNEDKPKLNNDHEPDANDSHTSSDNREPILPDSKPSNSLGLDYTHSHESMRDLNSSNSNRARVVGNWHRLFNQIRQKSSPTLALRYKPSHESLKRVPKSRSFTSKSKLANEDLRLETSFFPPYQTAVVREVAPAFAQRAYIPEDSDSVCSGTIQLRIPLLKTPRSRSTALASSDVGDIPLPTAAKSLSLISQMAKSGNSKTKRRPMRDATNSNNSRTVKGDGSKTATGGVGNTKTLPTLRQRQLELHRYRLLIEKRRLELLDLKIVRERADALRHEILFHKDLQLKHNQIKSYEDNNSSQA